MYYNAGARKHGRVRCIGNRDHVRRQLPCGLVHRIFSDQKDRATAEPIGGIRALLEEIAGDPDGCGAQGKDDWRIA